MSAAEYRKSHWTNGSFSIRWLDNDQIVIIDHRIGRQAVMDGGEFEYSLQALIAAYQAGKSEE